MLVEQPPAELFDLVMVRLSQEQKIVLIKKRLAYLSIFLVIATVAFFPAIVSLKNEIINSGFGQYLILIFYDFKTTLTYWQDYSLSLLETLPAISLAASLLIILTILALIRSISRYTQMLIKLSPNH